MDRRRDAKAAKANLKPGGNADAKHRPRRRAKCWFVAVYGSVFVGYGSV
jgi:hypothetical protein